MIIDNDRHVITARYQGDQAIFVLEAVGDTSNNLNGSFPRLDFASLWIDVNQNGRADRGVDLSLGTTGNNVFCDQFFQTDTSYTGCGAARTGGQVQVSFEATERGRRSHPVWTFTIPKAKLAQAGASVAHLVFQFHESGRGYTRYPEGRSGVPFSKVLHVPLVARRMVQIARPQLEYVRLENLGTTSAELVRTDRHVISAEKGRGTTTFVMEAIGDRTNNLRGTFPRLDFASIGVDVDKNLRATKNVDVSYGISGGSHDQICPQKFLGESSFTGCGGYPSRATLAVAFEATAASSRPHPVWRFTIPNRELTSGSVAHLVFRFHESGKGYTRYPASNNGNATFNTVAALNLKTLTGGVRPEPPEAPAAEEEADDVVVVENDTTPPSISIDEPVESGGRVTLDAKTVMIRGHADDVSGVMEVKVQGQDASVSASGEFWREVPLAIGENQIRIRVSDMHGNWAECGVTVVRESGAAPPLPTTARSSPPNPIPPPKSSPPAPITPCSSRCRTTPTLR